MSDKVHFENSTASQWCDKIIETWNACSAFLHTNVEKTASMKESGFLATLWRLVWLGVNLGAPARTGSLCETGLCLYLLFITAEQAVSSDCTAREKKRRKKVISVYCTSASMLLSLYNASEIIQGNLVDDSPSHAELLKLKGANNHVFSLRCCFWKVFKTYCCTVRFMHSLDTTSHS